MPNTLGKVCAFSENVLDISWLHFDYILGSAGLYWASHQDSENMAHGYCFSYSLGVFVFVFVFVFVIVFVFAIVFVFVFVFLCHFLAIIETTTKLKIDIDKYVVLAKGVLSVQW